MNNLKEVFENKDNNVIITKILKGDRLYRVDARTRNHIADGVNFYSEWGSANYINRLSRLRFGKNVEDLLMFRDK